ncbi:MAG: pilus assembly protein TadG-related protein [Methylacidiphilales bacterium]|nr:pilus assembly protein TadG-related protein [Candidatus Methylacidiphilales bacterium]
MNQTSVGIFHNRPETRNQNGSAILLLCLAIVALIGFMAISIDYGRMALTADQLQKACDAAALAAAVQMQLDTSTSSSTRQANATTKAQLLGTQNGVTISSVTFSSPIVTVTGTCSQTFFFASVVGGANSGMLTRQANANYNTPMTGVSGGLPIAITIGDYTSHLGGSSFTLTLVDNQKKDFSNGNIVALSTQAGNGKSPSQWQSDLTNGITSVDGGTVPFGTGVNLDSINASLNPQQSSLHDGLINRIGQTVAIFVTTTASQSNGNTGHYVQGIAIVKLVSVDNNGNLTLQIPQVSNPSGLSSATSSYNDTYNSASTSALTNGNSIHLTQ